MKKILLKIFICFIFNTQLILASNKFCPPADKVLLVIGQDNKTIEEYISNTNIVPAGFMVYTSIQTMGGLYNKSKDYGSGTFYANDLIRKYPNVVLQIGLYMVGQLQNTIDGKYDHNIQKLITWLKDINTPVFLRIGYEFDGLHNHYDPNKYKQAFIYIVEKIKNENVNNIAFVWHANASDPTSPILKWFPGDKYVDWIGISYFDQPNNFTFPVIKFAKKHSKPVMIAESTPKGIGAYDKLSWKAWYYPLFKFIKDYDIKMLCYINSNWEKQPMWSNQGWEDARVHKYNFVKTNWINEIKNNRFLQSSKNLFNLINHKPNSSDKFT